MSRPQLLNEDEINEFLARSDSDDDSDWDNIGEVDEEELLKCVEEPNNSKINVVIPKKAEKKKAVTYRQISDIGLDVLFAQSSKEKGKNEEKKCNGEDEDPYLSRPNLNQMGQFIQDKLSAQVDLENEQRMEKEIEQLDRKYEGKMKDSVVIEKKSTTTAVKADGAIGKDYFIPSGTSIRVIKPRISSQTWLDRIHARKICRLSSLIPKQVEELGESEWLTVGVVVRPPDVRRTKGGTGNPFSIWRLCDLENFDRIVSLFLFGSAHHQLWKEAARGLVVALLRPRLMSSNGDQGKFKSDEVSLTVDKAPQALILGLSKDFGTCNSRTKAGAMCQNIVNKSLCEFCEFHVRNMYRNAGNNRSGFAQAIGAQAKRLAAGNSNARRSILPKKGELRDLQRMAGLGPITGMSAGSEMTQISRNVPQASFQSSYGHQKCNSMPAGSSQAMMNSNRMSVSSMSQMLSNNSHNASANSKMFQNSGNPFEKSSRENPHFERSNSLPGTPQTTKQISTYGCAGMGNLLKANSSSNLSQGSSVSEKPNNNPQGGNSEKPLDSFTSFFKEFEGKRSPLLIGVKPTAPRLSDPAQDFARARAAELLRRNGGAVAMQKIERKRQVLSRIQANSDASCAQALPASLSASKKRKSCAPDIFPIPRPSVGSKEEDPKSMKRRKLLKTLGCDTEEDLKREIARGTRHVGLVDEEDKEREERHFRALEFREKYEEKLSSVKEHQVKTVSCSICKYRAEGSKPNPNCLLDHASAIKYGKGQRRYFKCKECGERTTSLEKLPKFDCRKCGSSNFERTGMLRERKGPKLVNETLLVRGTEHGKFLHLD